MKIKAIFKGILYVLLIPWKVLCLIGRVICLAFSYIENASDLFVRKIVCYVGDLREAYFSINTENNRHSTAKIFFYGMMSIVVSVILSYVLYFSVYFVPVGGGAAVTRFGGHVRSVGMGMHFRIPLIERYYIVQTGFVREERFGFMQVLPPIRHQQLTDVERAAQVHYESNLLSKESDSDIFSNKGAIQHGLQQSQRLTHDYLREMLIGEREVDTIDQAVRLTERNRQEVQALEAQGVSLNGRIIMPDESKYITYDVSIIQLAWTLQYKISNMEEYLFNSRDVKQNVHDIGLAKMREVIGQAEYSQIMTTGRGKVEEHVGELIQQDFDKLKLGLEVTRVIVIDALPLDSVQPAFEEVNRAAQDKEAMIYKAHKYYNSLIPKARGEAEEAIFKARAYQTRLKNEAEGKASRFSQVVEEYINHPEVTKNLIYFDVMSKMLNETPTTIVGENVKGILPIFAGGSSSQTTDLTQALLAALLAKAQADAPAAERLHVSEAVDTAAESTIAESTTTAATTSASSSLTAQQLATLKVPRTPHTLANTLRSRAP